MQWHPTPVLLPGKSHGRRSLVACSPWGRRESDTTERHDFHFSLSCIGEGNGNPLQCSCLENPRARGAWWAEIYGVAQSWTRLKLLSSSSISLYVSHINAYTHTHTHPVWHVWAGNGNQLQYSFQENFMDRGAWWASAVHRIAKSWT